MKELMDSIWNMPKSDFMMLIGILMILLAVIIGSLVSSEDKAYKEFKSRLDRDREGQ